MMMHWLRSKTQHHLLFNLYCPCSSDVVPRAALVTVVEGSLHSIEEEPQNQHDAGTVKTSVSCPIHQRIRSTDDFVFTSQNSPRGRVSIHRLHSGQCALPPPPSTHSRGEEISTITNNNSSSNNEENNNNNNNNTHNCHPR